MKYVSFIFWVAFGVFIFHVWTTTRECEAKGGLIVNSVFSLATCIKAEVLK